MFKGLKKTVVWLCSINLVYLHFAANPIGTIATKLAPQISHNEPVTLPFKIAFLFLTRDHLATPKIWNKFFGNENDKKYYNIYVHPKYASNITVKQPYLYNNILPKHLLIKNTTRFQFSLVQASNALFKYALNDDKLNKKFVLLSETHIPLYRFNKIYDILTYNNNNLSFGLEQGTEGKHNCFQQVYERMFHHYQNKIGKNISTTEFAEKYVARNNCLHTTQWIILDRYIITNYLLKYETYWNQFFLGVNRSFADEDYYANMIRKFMKSKQEKQSIKPKGTTFYYFDPSDETHAAYFNNISNEWIDDLRDNGYLFMRKVNQSSVIHTDYVLR